MVVIHDDCNNTLIQELVPKLPFICTKYQLATIYRSKDMMILVNCGCCGVASGYGYAVWCTYGATGVEGTVLYEAEERRADG